MIEIIDITFKKSESNGEFDFSCFPKYPDLQPDDTSASSILMAEIARRISVWYLFHSERLFQGTPGKRSQTTSMPQKKTATRVPMSSYSVNKVSGKRFIFHQNEWFAIMVFIPKGKGGILPKDATALDFAFEIHSKIGLHAIHARINGKQFV